MDQSDFDKLMDHEYDGVREYDNPLPGWWKQIFVVTIIFAIGYLIYYHGGGSGVSETEAYDQELAAHYARAAELAAQNGPIDESTLAKLAADESSMSKVAGLFKTNCVVCHGSQGEGKIGPNLTDEFQIHGKTRLDIYNVIVKGVPAKGMIAWGKVLRPGELINVAAYISTLRGKNIAGKAPDGQKVGPFIDDSDKAAPASQPEPQSDKQQKDDTKTHDNKDAASATVKS